MSSDTTLVITDFPSLGPDGVYDILALRSAVFVVEQQCPYFDMDDVDRESTTLHYRALQQGTLVAYLRTFPHPEDASALHIGRVCTDAAHRHERLATLLMNAVLGRDPGRTMHLNAQAYLEEWYGSFGFVRSGEPFDEIGILHVPMVRAAPGQ